MLVPFFRTIHINGTMSVKATESTIRFRKALGKILQDRRTELHKTQDEVSYLGEVSKVALGQWEHGHKTPDLEKLIPVINVLYPDPSVFWKQFHQQYDQEVRPILQVADREKIGYHASSKKKKRKDPGSKK